MSDSKFYFRINKIKILDDREKGSFFKKDRAEVRIFSFVTNENTDLSELSDWDNSKSNDEKKEIIKSVVSKCISSRLFLEIDNVKDNQILTFGDSGCVLYQDDKIPSDFNWILIVIESDQKDRDFGKLLDDTSKGADFKDIIDAVGKMVKISPTGSMALAVAKFITGIFSTALKKNNDDLIGVVYMSLNRIEHYPHCIRDKQDVPDITNNMYVDYSIFGCENIKE